ncbi:hypothetical protein RND81_02G118700 [Saponaria officinalis]|uniref:Uncharacterized protein n=1 Tax=Saponaria officinalis TaxID=3572 RepID=A0AAW1MPE7_SAPOF
MHGLEWRRATHKALISKTFIANSRTSNKEEMASDQMPLEQMQNGAQVTMLNQTPTSMTLFRSVTWAGSPCPPCYPARILPNESVVFNNPADPRLGSKAAVFYAADGPFNARAWVLAWDAPVLYTPTSNKVFVLCGPKSLIESMTDDQVLEALEKSSESSQCPGASATIRYLPDKKIAAVTANFGGL